MTYDGIASFADDRSFKKNEKMTCQTGVSEMSETGAGRVGDGTIRSSNANIRRLCFDLGRT